MLDYLTIIIKPTNACNMRCKHCYHNEKGYDTNIMSLELIQHLFCLLKDSVKNLKIIWHGGEPLIVGIDYYKAIMDLETKFFNNQNVKNCIQTNASLLTNEYIRFFNENKFDIGVSFDGPYNDLLREKSRVVESNIELLKSNKSDFGILTVLTSQTITKWKEIYEYFNLNRLGFKFAYIFESGAAKFNNHLLIDETTYIDEINKFFDYWIADNNCNIHVDNFEKFIKMILFNGVGECEYSSCLFHFLGIDSNGNIYPCGRAYTDEYKMGNLNDFNSIENIFETDNYKKLLINSILRRSVCKDNCEYFIYCQGGCNNNAIMENGINKNGGFSCKTFKKIFEHIKVRVQQIKDKELEIHNPFLINLLKSSK